MIFVSQLNVSASQLAFLDNELVLSGLSVGRL